MTASFGKLRGDSLELTEGLNIIKAPNESGKSTWCAFIRAMLYGINTSERDKQGFLSDKNKYQPWSGELMSGTMEISHLGKDITLTRQSTAQTPMKNFSAVYTGTAQRVPELSGTSAGEYLTGAPEKVYERTAFIRQQGMRINQTNELEKRIAALVSSGGEQRSYTETEGEIKQWMRKLKYNKSGSIPKLEDELSLLKDRYAAIERRTEELSDLRQTMERAGETKEKLSKELDLHRKVEKRNMLRSYTQAKALEEKAILEIKELKKQLTVNGHLPTRDDINEARTKCSTLDSLNILYMKAAGTRQAAEEAYENAEKTYKETDFYGKYDTEELAHGKAAFVTSYDPAPPSPPSAPPIPETYSKQILACLICAAAGLIFGLVGLFAYLPLKEYAPVGIAVSALCLIFAGLFKNKASKAKAAADAFEMPVEIDPLEEYIEKFGEMSLEELKDKAGEYLAAMQVFQDAKAAYFAAVKSFEDAENSVKAAEELILSTTDNIVAGVTDPYSVLGELAAVEAIMGKLSTAEFEKASARSVIDSLSEAVSGETEVSENDFLPVPLYSYESTREQYDEANAEYDSLRRTYNIAYGELKALGDVAVIKSRISEVQEELNEQNMKYMSLELALRALSDSNNELQTRFSPVISRLAGQYMSMLTGGRYSDIVFDKAFNAMAKTSGDVVSRSILSLSEGTADQIYLALRLAMSTLILSGEEPAPIVLDDALVNFDNKRMLYAIRLLRRMGTQRQIILFTCHDRELEAAANYDDINTIVFVDEPGGSDEEEN